MDAGVHGWYHGMSVSTDPCITWGYSWGINTSALWGAPAGYGAVVEYVHVVAEYAVICCWRVMELAVSS